MRTTVSAILVAENGGVWLEETLKALASQSMTPDRVVIVVNGANDELGKALAHSGVDAVFTTGAKRSFGEAVAHAEQSLDPVDPGEHEELLWLLTEDSAPEPRALRYLFRQVAAAPSVAIAGPKLIDWDHPERIVELGQSLTRHGSRWLLRRQELDQQQYDHLQDTMGVGPTGMLVRRSVWRDLGGFDPALPAWDDGLDFSVRARLAGHRVVVAPKARVRAALSGVAGPRIDRSRKVMRQAHRKARTAQLHRRLSYAPALLAPIYWLGLPFVAVLRVLWSLLREQPGYMVGEFVSAFSVMFRPASIVRARKRIRHNNIAGWAAVRPLRVDPKTVRTSRIIDREAILSAQGRRRSELHFISTGGLSVLLVSVVLSVVLTWWLFVEDTLTGGSMIPLNDIGPLWQNTRMLEGVPADPFTWVLAVLGTLTFFNPSLALVVFLAASIPLASLGGWLWGAQFTHSTAGRALAAFAWALSPVVLGSIDHGRFGTVLLAVILPWLLIAATRAHQSWSWAGTASILAAAGLATAPILIPIALLLWILGMVIHPRNAARVASTAIAPAVLFLPKLAYVLTNGKFVDLFRDPGVNGPYEPGSLWHLLLGFPEFGLEGWGSILDSLGIQFAPATLIVGVLFLPLALLALLGLFTGKVSVSIFSALLGGLGLATAVAAGQISLTTSGTEQVPLWTGSGLALYWIAIVTLAGSGTSVLGKAGGPLATVAVLCAALGIAPLASHMLLGHSEVRESSSGMPSIVQAAGAQDPALRTLVITAEGDNQLHTEVVRGSGRHLDDIRSSTYTSRLTADDEAIAELTGSLASLGATDLEEQFQHTNIGYVLLRETGDASERGQLQSVMDEHGTLEGSGRTDAGILWRVVEATDGEVPEAAASDQATVFNLVTWKVTAHTVWWIQIIVLVGMFLLALPTGEVVERPERRKRPKVKKGAPVNVTVASAGGIDLVSDEAFSDAVPETPEDGGGQPEGPIDYQYEESPVDDSEFADTGEPADSSDHEQVAESENISEFETTAEPEIAAEPETTAEPEAAVETEATEAAAPEDERTEIGDDIEADRAQDDSTPNEIREEGDHE